MVEADGRVSCLKLSRLRSCGHQQCQGMGMAMGVVRLRRGSTLWRRGSKGRESQAPKGCLLWVLKRDWRDHGDPGAKTTRQCRGRTSLEMTAERRGNG